MTRRALTLWSSLVGVVTALVTLATAQVLSAALGGVGDPLLAVGSLLVDLAPPELKTLVIDLFSTGDKLFLFLSIAVVLLALSVIVGVLQLRKPPLGLLVLVGVGAVALLAVVTRAGVTPLSPLPILGGLATGILLLRVLIGRLSAWRDARQPIGLQAPGTRNWAEPQHPASIERRRFLVLALVAGISAAVVGSAARTMSAASSAVTAVRKAILLPAAVAPAPELAVTSTLDVAGISPFVTPTADFYRIDTALQVPAVDPTTWKLRITGMVEQEIEIGFDELLALPLEEHYVTLACVSNEVGGNLIGNALWRGYPIRELLARARPTAGADMVLSTSIDGFTASTPLSILTDADTAALLAVGMNGALLPLDHGFPVRMVVPGLFGYVSATKWVVELKVTTFAKDMGYWTSRGWSAKGPVKLSSRIDTPLDGSTQKAGRLAIAGVAWAQHTGISRVEVRVDDGAWQEATLANRVTPDAWLQWSYDWAATSGMHRVTVRAVDSNGRTQTAAEAPPAPDGSTGVHGISVRVS
ncbi:MAG: molybdopterin-dependent oxidoreductase [Microbacteriaceae bacterium]|nr:molybdopterin-dependent oxidoreductase [Microbacteriaceae bacterium]